MRNDGLGSVSETEVKSVIEDEVKSVIEDEVKSVIVIEDEVKDEDEVKSVIVIDVFKQINYFYQYIYEHEYSCKLSRL